MQITSKCFANVYLFIVDVSIWYIAFLFLYLQMLYKEFAND